MADIFRKKSLDKLSSPEQLDKIIVISSPMVWLALIGGGFIILVTLLWGIFGKVPITKEGSGILLSDGDVTSVYAGTEGVVTKVYVSSGDTVKVGDVLYEVDSQQSKLLVQNIEERIQKVEAITFDSTDDEVTSDNQSLISIKNEKLTLSTDNEANQASLEKLKEEYSDKEDEVSGLKATLDKAQKTYYNSISTDDSATVEYQYSVASSEYQTAKSNYETANASYKSQKVQCENYKAQWDEAKQKYEELKDSEDAVEQAEALEYQKAAEQYKQTYEAAKKVLDTYKTERDKMKETMDEKKTTYTSKKSAYESYLKNSSSSSSLQTQYANDYSTALSNYNTANSELKSIESEIQTLETKISLGEKSIEIQEESLEAQFDAAKSAIIDSLNLEAANYNTVLENNQITATVDGTVYTTFVTNGSTVSVDTEVLRINEGQEDNTLQAVYFLSLDSGKVVKEGMKINVYVNTLQKEEYGHMTGTVVSVADYVTSQADLYTRLGDSTLASTFTSSGAVVEVVCELEKDSDTTSGFEWSSNKGKTVELTEGMLLEGSVIIEDVAPITMLIPKLKEKFSLE